MRLDEELGPSVTLIYAIQAYIGNVSTAVPLCQSGALADPSAAELSGGINMMATEINKHVAAFGVVLPAPNATACPAEAQQYEVGKQTAVALLAQYRQVLSEKVQGAAQEAVAR